MFALSLLLLFASAPPATTAGDTPNDAPAETLPPSAAEPRWELGDIEVRGTAPKPGVVFIEAEREKARAVMQALLAETRSGGLADVEVSRPAALPTATPRVFQFQVRGPVRPGAILKSIESTLPRLQDCRRAERPALPTDLLVRLELVLGERGEVLRSRVLGTQPKATRAGRCVLARVKRAAFPGSPAGDIRVQVGLRLPPPLISSPTASTREDQAAPPPTRPQARR